VAGFVNEHRKRVSVLKVVFDSDPNPQKTVKILRIFFNQLDFSLSPLN